MIGFFCILWIYIIINIFGSGGCNRLKIFEDILVGLEYF